MNKEKIRFKLMGFDMEYKETAEGTIEWLRDSIDELIEELENVEEERKSLWDTLQKATKDNIELKQKLGNYEEEQNE